MPFKPFNSNEEFVSFDDVQTSENNVPTAENIDEENTTLDRKEDSMAEEEESVRGWEAVGTDKKSETAEKELPNDFHINQDTAGFHINQDTAGMIDTEEPSNEEDKSSLEVLEEEEVQILEKTNSVAASDSEMIEVKPAGFLADSEAIDCSSNFHNTEELSHPDYYQGSKDELEPIKIIQNLGMNFCIGNAYKYLMRAGKKPGAALLDDYKKVYWYLLAEREDPFEYIREESLTNLAPNILDVAEAFQLSYAIGRVVEYILNYWTSNNLLALNDSIELMGSIIRRVENAE